MLIELAQRWPPTRVLPRWLHEWDWFIRPDELSEMLNEHNIRIEEVRGLSIPPMALPRAARALVNLKRGRVTYAEAGRRIRLRTVAITQVANLGTATLDL